MTVAEWVAWAVLAAGFVLVLLAVRTDRRDWADLSADLDDTNRVVDDLAVELSRVLDHLDDGTPSDGRHAATTEIAISKEPQA